MMRLGQYSIFEAGNNCHTCFCRFVKHIYKVHNYNSVAKTQRSADCINYFLLDIRHIFALWRGLKWWNSTENLQSLKINAGSCIFFKLSWTVFS